MYSYFNNMQPNKYRNENNENNENKLWLEVSNTKPNKQNSVNDLMHSHISAIHNLTNGMQMN